MLCIEYIINSVFISVAYALFCKRGSMVVGEITLTPKLLEIFGNQNLCEESSLSDPPIRPVRKTGFIDRFTTIGDIIGVILDNVENLIGMPYGCGEQQMLTTAPNVYILRYLRATGSLKIETETKCKKYLLSGDVH